MMPGLTHEKRELRKKLRDSLKALSTENSAADSLKASALLRQQSVWQKARTILFYSPTLGEIDLSAVMAEGLRDGKTIALPRFIDDERHYGAFQITDAALHCAPGKFGIPEPKEHCPSIPLNQLDLVLAPGVGFDAAGHRLGRGKGFYDRLLAQTSGIKCGVAFDPQIVERIPAEEHDVRMNCILTPTRWLEIS
jgi:5-formyltetrahydrofolate cyclo-ligase